MPKGFKMPLDNSALFEICILLGGLVKQRKAFASAPQSEKPLSALVMTLEKLISLRSGAQDEWSEEKHPRGQPGNAGEFASEAGGGTGGSGSASKQPPVMGPVTKGLPPSAYTAPLTGTELHEFNQGRLKKIEEEEAKKSWEDQIKEKAHTSELYSKLTPLLEATGLKPQTLADLPKTVLAHGDIREAEDVNEDNIAALKAFRGAVDSMTGSKSLDKFREHLYKTAKVVACNFEPSNAIMATTTDDDGNPLFMVNMQVSVKQYITDKYASQFNHSMQKGYEVFSKTGNLQDALAATYKGTVQHELGHAFDAWCSHDLSNLVIETIQGPTFESDEEKGLKYVYTHVSEYACKSQMEAAAEIFNMVVDGSKIPPKLGAIAKYIKGT